MMKKIGYFLMAMLVLWSFLLLNATQNRSASQPQTEPEPASSTAPPASAETDGTEPPERTEPPLVTAPEAGEAPSWVEKLLQDRELERTEKTHWVQESGLNDLEGTQGTAGGSLGRELAELSARQSMNPIAAFWLLVSEDLYEKTPDRTGRLEVRAFAGVQQEKKQYPYTDEGAALLLTDLLALAGQMDDGLELEQALLGAEGMLTAEQVYESAPERCRYAYFAAGGDRSTHFLCFYLRSGDGETITDVEFQLLNLRSAQGEPEDLQYLDLRGDRQAAALMAAAELLMTGSSVAISGDVSFGYTLTGWDASVERFNFTAEDESGCLTNYRLQK